MSSSPLRSKCPDDLQLHWQEIVKQAQNLYLQATLQHIQIAAEVRRDEPDAPEGEFAIAKARRAAAAALYVLSRAIQIYSDLVLRGIIPAEDDDTGPV